MVLHSIVYLILSATMAILVAASIVMIKALLTDCNENKGKVLVPVFIGSLALLALLGSENLNTYPYSNILVFVFSIFAGSLLGSLPWKRKHAFFAILVVVSVLDITSFVGGAQAGSPPSNFSNVSLYIDFTLKLGSNFAFRVGSLDLLILSSALMFFALRKVRIKWLFAISLFSLTLPFAFLWIAPTGGLPLTPFIALVVLLFQSISGARSPQIGDAGSNLRKADEE